MQSISREEALKISQQILEEAENERKYGCPWWDDDLEEVVTSFYSKLLLEQEPIGEEFEQALHDNLWDLLVRT